MFRKYEYPIGVQINTRANHDKFGPTSKSNYWYSTALFQQVTESPQFRVHRLLWPVPVLPCIPLAIPSYPGPLKAGVWAR